MMADIDKEKTNIRHSPIEMVPQQNERVGSPGERQRESPAPGSAGLEHKRTSPPPSSSSPTNSVRSHPAPIMINSQSNRPPSTTSVHSNGSAGPRSTTATSRRGGRTRSRSPPIMVQRPASTGPTSEPGYHGQLPSDRAPPSPANPSAAAAAAAAAAKSITRNPPPPPSSWYDSSEARDRDYRRSRESGRYQGRYYEGGQQPRHNWPAEEQGPPQSRSSRYPPRRGDEHYGYREGYSYRQRSNREPYPYVDNAEYEGRTRYPDSRYEERRPRSTSPRPGYEYRGREPRHARDDPYYKGPEHEGSRAEAGTHSSVKRTTRVIGTATPIHVPRAAENPSRGSRGGQSGSIFRGRPGDEGHKPGTVPEEEPNPQKILMSLRTPSNSFEEKPAKSGTKREGDPLSPEAPPPIHHSHHQNTADSSLFFEPQRSPKNGNAAGPPQPSSSIDMAPSFTLFNQSFDSIGDTANFFNVSGPLDVALQSTSFGAGPSGSDDKGNELQLHRSTSGGNFSQQILGGSGSGALTFGMSPSNSFGGGSSSARGGNMMVLGGQEHRSSSPSQVLDMYRSYSGAGPSPRPKGGPLEDSHMRMSGSLAAPSLGNSYTRSFGDPPPPGQFRGNNTGHPDGSDGQNFYVFLKRHKGAFKECSFLLPGLKSALLEVPDVKQEDADGTPKRHTRNGDPNYGEPNPQDIAIGLRRVASAVCAFGGTFMGDRTSQKSSTSSSQSIFREKPGESATVTPSSSAGTSPGTSHRARQKAKYDEVLPSRYYENDNRLSWEFEENPPVDDNIKEEEEANDNQNDNESSIDDKLNSSATEGETKVKNEGGDSESQESGDGKKTPTPGGKDGDQPKMRYRCKLCGQPKQNHTCPYQQSLARSIGTMVYPAVNAFTSAEPGSLAPALSEMNNFILSGSESVSSAETSPSRPTPDRMRRLNQGLAGTTAQVTPESLRGTPRGPNSPVTTPQRVRTPGSSRRSRGPPPSMERRYLGGSPSSASRKKRSHSAMNGSDDQGELLFVEAVDLKPEQFRMVTSSKVVNAPDAFTYPSLPLPYAQRKRLSDNLFSLSKEVPRLTDECAAVLREARERDLWDLAVAELMTQVVVVVHCHDDDSRFEGLRRYLLTLGISC